MSSKYRQGSYEQVETVLSSRSKNNEKEYLIKWKNFPYPTWQSQTNCTLHPFLINYFALSKGTFTQYPAIFPTHHNHQASIQYLNNKLTICLSNTPVQSFQQLPLPQKTSILNQLQTLFYLQANDSA